MAIFYTPDIEREAILPEEESVHCIRVLRKQVGDTIDLIDGKGTFYTAVIVDDHPKRCRVEIRSSEPDRDRYQAYIAVAPTKNADRTEWFVEKATEIGIGGFYFVGTRHSERKTLKKERVEKVVVAALKQSVKALKPLVGELVDFQTFVQQPFEGAKFICHCHPGEKPLLNAVCPSGVPVLVLIGPEGDFSPEEVDLAARHGFVAVSLGHTRLRTETAAFVAAHIVQLKNLTD
jgi:16S rRNA (uracil1498-N3)-methyltransferase